MSFSPQEREGFFRSVKIFLVTVGSTGAGIFAARMAAGDNSTVTIACAIAFAGLSAMGMRNYEARKDGERAKKGDTIESDVRPRGEVVDPYGPRR